MVMNNSTRAVVKDSGLTCGNDRYVTFDCGHTECWDGDGANYTPKIGELLTCTQCEYGDDDEA